MAVIEKLAKVIKGTFASSNGSAVTLPYGQAQNTNAGADYDLRNYLSAMPPLDATAPKEYEIRQRDFRIGENLDYIPGGGKFPYLQGFADRWNVLRTIIDTKKDLVASTPWSIKKEPDGDEPEINLNQEQVKDPVVKQLTEFWRSPDGIHTWFEWIRLLLEEIYVIDAGCIEFIRDKDGKICALHIVAGNTINRVIDDRAWTPSVPRIVNGQEVYPVAYQQVLSGGGGGSEGIPQRNLTVRDMLYCMRNPRASHKWGQSSVEKILQYCMTGVLADKFIAMYYTSGSQPEGIMVMSGMTPEKIEEYEKKWNATYSGNLATRRRVAIISAGAGDQKSVQYIPTKEPLLKSDIYMDYIRFACAEFSVPAQPFEKPMNRASAEQASDTATEQGLIPDLKWLEEKINTIIKSPLYFNLPNYTFQFGERTPVDQLKAANTNKTQVTSGAMTLNEWRKKIGLPPSNTAEADMLGTLTPNGFIPLDRSQLAPQPEPKPEPENDNAQ